MPDHDCETKSNQDERDELRRALVMADEQQLDLDGGKAKSDDPEKLRERLCSSAASFSC